MASNLTIVTSFTQTKAMLQVWRLRGQCWGDKLLAWYCIQQFVQLMNHAVTSTHLEILQSILVRPLFVNLRARLSRLKVAELWGRHLSAHLSDLVTNSSWTEPSHERGSLIHPSQWCTQFHHMLGYYSMSPRLLGYASSSLWYNP